MWKRKELKQKGRRNLYNNYWRILGVIVISSFVASGFQFKIEVGQGIADMKMALSHSTTKQSIEVSSRWVDKSTAEILDEVVNTNGSDNVYKTLGRAYKPTHGVLAAFYNKVVGAESFLMGMLHGTNELVFKNKIGQGIIIMLGALLMLFLWMFVATPLNVGKCRYLLETRSYDDTQIGRITFIWKVSRVKKTAVIMALKQAFWIMWCFTIVGGFVKYYSYKMIPYILAENPDISRKEAFELSNEMIKGQRWNAFKLDLSFLGWEILNLITLGFLGWIFVKPYKETTYVELYLSLREEAKEKTIENSDLLFDEYIGLNPNIGVYPIDNYPLQEKKSKNGIKLNYKKSYSITSLILIFFTLSMLGWIWEVMMHLVQDGEFVNRGILFGPWLPIYGSGGILIIVLLRRFAEKPWLTFLLATGICGVLEYTTGLYLLETKGARWWDYTGYFLNIQGIVCAEGLIIFGIGGMAFIYILGPFFDNLYSKVSQKAKIAICVMLIILFGMDLMYSSVHPNMGRGITEQSNSAPIK